LQANVELINVTKRYGAGGAVAVDTVSLSIPSGSYCCLLGPSRLRQDEHAADDRRARGGLATATC
jgi:hypothetical protein